MITTQIQIDRQTDMLSRIDNNNRLLFIDDKSLFTTNRHNNSFLDIINKKLEYLENIERSITVERKNNSFLDLLEKLKALN